MALPEPISLPRSLQQWLAAPRSQSFNEAFRAEVEALAPHRLPLQQALLHSSALSDEPLRVVVIASEGDERAVRIKAGIFFSGIIAGCSCADDPTPVEPVNEYCELLFTLDRQSGRSEVTLLP